MWRRAKSPALRWKSERSSCRPICGSTSTSTAAPAGPLSRAQARGRVDPQTPKGCEAWISRRIGATVDYADRLADLCLPMNSQRAHRAWTQAFGTPWALRIDTTRAEREIAGRRGAAVEVLVNHILGGTMSVPTSQS